MQKLPDEHHVLRWAGLNRLHREGDKVLGLLPQALDLNGHAYLSVTWVEYFQGNQPEQIVRAVQAFRNSRESNPPRSAFGMANVGIIKSMCGGHSRPAKVRILHERIDSNPAHSGIHRLPAHDAELMELLVAEAFTTVILNKDIPSADS